MQNLWKTTGRTHNNLKNCLSIIQIPPRRFFIDELGLKTALKQSDYDARVEQTEKAYRYHVSSKEGGSIIYD